MRPELKSALNATYGRYPSRAVERVSAGRRHDDLIRAERKTLRAYQVLLAHRDNLIARGFPLPPKLSTDIGEARGLYELVAQTLSEFEERVKFLGR